MASYIVRVELYGSPSEQDYARLHSAMAAKGGSRTITLDGGEEYHLPPAEYLFNTNDDIDTVWTKANSAASSVWNQHGILVTKSAGIRVSGLRQARSAVGGYYR
jgi:hypothetical protein